ncbi:MAG TPA: nucleoside-diphosphate kinase [Acidimicrobiales bacterium]|nr:nucleoside-diphosphate kinase [Acidimicrobiales bacterium]
MERTLVICKPDALERALVGDIIGRLEGKGLRMIAVELRTIDAATAGQHYGEHEGEAFFDGLIAFITGGPALLMVVEGPEGTVDTVRLLIGATDPAKAEPGTIRGDLATETTRNLVHASDSIESAAREIDLFFPNLTS